MSNFADTTILNIAYRHTLEYMAEEKDVIILGIESSCDDTSAAVIRNGLLLSNVIASQKVHEEFGGVVPELASRAHQQNTVCLLYTSPSPRD